jgi:hypothetical protein
MSFFKRKNTSYSATLIRVAVAGLKTLRQNFLLVKKDFFKLKKIGSDFFAISNSFFKKKMSRVQPKADSFD